jgi:hypothetical protein
MPSIDISRIWYKAYIVSSTGKVVEVPDLRTLSYGESDQELAMTSSVDLDNLLIDGQYLHEYAGLGSHFKIYSNWGQGTQEVFDGIVFVNDPITIAAPHVQLTSYDPLIYLDKSKDEIYYPAGKTGAYIIRDLLQKWNVPIGKITGPNKPLAIQVFHGDSIATAINSVLQQSVLVGDDTYILQFKNEVANVIEVGQNSDVYVITDAQGGAQVDDQWSIENMITRVLIKGKTEPNGTVATASVVNGQTQYGILQDIISESSYTNMAQATQAAQQILQESGQPILNRQLTAVDLPFLRRGDAVEVHMGTLDGVYIVSGVQHDPSTRTMVVSFNDIIGAAPYPKNRQGRAKVTKK